MSDGHTNEAENPGTDDAPGGEPADETDAEQTAVVSGDSDPTDGDGDGDSDGDGEPDEDTKQEIEEEREQRLAPENRPENAEVDNTNRTFDVDHGQFTDSEEYDENEPAPFSDPEDPNNPDNDDSDDDSDDGSDSGDGDADKNEDDS